MDMDEDSVSVMNLSNETLLHLVDAATTAAETDCDTLYTAAELREIAEELRSLLHRRVSRRTAGYVFRELDWGYSTAVNTAGYMARQDARGLIERERRV